MTAKGLPIACPNCDETFHAPDGFSIDQAVDAHDRECPGRLSVKPRTRPISCPDCGKHLAEIGVNARNAVEQERRAKNLHAKFCPGKRPAPPNTGRKHLPPASPAGDDEQPRLEDPPPPRSCTSPTTRYTAAVAMAVANPGRWVRLPGQYLSTPKVSGPKAARAFHGYNWSVTTRAVDDTKQRHVWIRCDGQPS